MEMTKGSKSELEFGDEAGVAEESFIENMVDGGAVVPARCGSRTTGCVRWSGIAGA